MPTQTREQALEAAIQEKLSGLTLEEIKERDPAANVVQESAQ